jgi:hypothetical protein
LALFQTIAYCFALVLSLRPLVFQSSVLMIDWLQWLPRLLVLLFGQLLPLLRQYSPKQLFLLLCQFLHLRVGWHRRIPLWRRRIQPERCMPWLMLARLLC